MASAAQITANRDNAQLSTGPKTPEGKANSSRNHTTHGFTTRLLYIPPDKQELYDSLNSALQAEIKPQGDLEIQLFSDLVRFRFNTLRCLEIEANLMDRSAEKGLDPFLDPETFKQLQNIQGYRRPNENGFYRSLNEMRKLQTERSFRQAVLEEGMGEEISPLINLSKVRTQYAKDERLRHRHNLDALKAALNAPIPFPQPPPPKNPPEPQVLKADSW